MTDTFGSAVSLFRIHLSTIPPPQRPSRPHRGYHDHSSDVLGRSQASTHASHPRTSPAPFQTPSSTQNYVQGAVIPTVIGAALLVGFSTDLQKYRAGSLIGIFMTSTYGSSLAILYSWSATNCVGSTKKNVTNALLLVAFALGSECEIEGSRWTSTDGFVLVDIVGTQIFPLHDAPNYLPGNYLPLDPRSSESDHRHRVQARSQSSSSSPL
jgi:hypothetical protein